MFDLAVSNNESLPEIQVRSQRRLLPAGLTHYPVHTGTLGRLSSPIRSRLQYSLSPQEALQWIMGKTPSRPTLACKFVSESVSCRATHTGVHNNMEHNTDDAC